MRSSSETTDFAHLIGRGMGGAATDVNALRIDNIRRVAGLDESEARFSLHGEFDISNKWQLFAALEPCIDSQTLTIDLADATFIDASTLGIFLQVARRRRELNATRLRIVDVSTHFRRILSLCELDDVFDVDDVPARKSKPPFSIAGSLAVTALS